jgi:hypothetical protein
MSENIKITISELSDSELKNQPYDYSSPIHDELRAPFMSPKPSSPKNNKFIPSVLGKRKYDSSFDNETFDDERYGQRINNDYFEKSMGHGVHFEPIEKKLINSIYEVDELLEWCEKYLASKKMM